MIKNKNRRKNTIIIIALCAILIILLGVILLSYAANESSMKYKKVIDELVRDYYPELAGKKIVVFERPFLGKGSATAFPFPPTITVSTRVRNYSEDSIKGLLAHELAHIYNNQDKNIFYFIGWFFSKKVKAEYERAADQHVIDIGLGEYLLVSAETDQIGRTPEELEKRYSVYGYLSPEEIRRQLGESNS